MVQEVVASYELGIVQNVNNPAQAVVWGSPGLPVGVGDFTHGVAMKREQREKCRNRRQEGLHDLGALEAEVPSQ